MIFSEAIQNRLRCPVTRTPLINDGDCLRGTDRDNQTSFPIIDEIPVLINESNSIFSIDDFRNRKDTTFNLDESQLKRTVRSIFPTIGVNVKVEKNYRELLGLLRETAKLLVIGGSVKGDGMDVLYAHESIEIVGSDVSFGPYVHLISDAHDIPFEDETFDCVVVQAVLEHVLDPARCVDEIYRVLKPKGLVYADTPFMQQVHMRQYDFTRFTHLGHRRLFRRFEEIGSGPCCGPGMALAWSYMYFLKSFVSSNGARKAIIGWPP